MIQAVDSSEFWEERYQKNEDGWDLKSPTPVFSDLINDKKLIEPCRLLIPGCGKGYDAIEAAKAGYKVTAIDFSEQAVSHAKKLAFLHNVNAEFLVQDFFKIDEKSTPPFNALYDYTFLCAINPGRRKDYLQKVQSLLTDGGKFIVLIFPVDGREGGPPFNIEPLSFYEQASEFFSLFYSSRNINSVKPRKGREILQIYIRK